MRRHSFGRAARRAAAPQLRLRLDLQQAVDRSGRRCGHRQDDPLQVARGRRLDARGRRRGDDAPLSLAQRARQLQSARVRSVEGIRPPVRRRLRGSQRHDHRARQRNPWATKERARRGVGRHLESCEQNVGTTDKTRLDQHLENVSVDRESSRREPCRHARALHRPGEARKLPDRQRQRAHRRAHAGDERSGGDGVCACDQTRVFSIMFSGSVGCTVFWQVGATTGHHSLTHDEPGDQPLVHATTIFTMKQFAKLLAALKAVPEGAGNLLDSSAILASSDVADGREHSIKDYPHPRRGQGRRRAQVPGRALSIEGREHQQCAAQHPQRGGRSADPVRRPGRPHQHALHRHRSLRVWSAGRLLHGDFPRAPIRARSAEWASLAPLERSVRIGCTSWLDDVAKPLTDRS